MPASIAKNAQEGTRSEYLAQYVLSAFGTAISVPHPEDSGIDLYCTLGKKVGRRFLVENSYLVQVKSAVTPISYNGFEEVKWLTGHKYPFFLCIVNKKQAIIELFQTIALSTLSAKGKMQSITLVPSENKKSEYFPKILDEDSVTIYLGKPIIKLGVTHFDNKNFREKLSQTLESWILLDQENIDLKSTGYTMYRIPENWETNAPILAKKFIGNFKDSQNNAIEQTKFQDLFLKFLSQLVNQAAAENDRPKYDSLINFIKDYLNQPEKKDCFGAHILQFCINEANKRFGIQERLLIKLTKKNA